MSQFRLTQLLLDCGPTRLVEDEDDERRAGRTPPPAGYDTDARRSRGTPRTSPLSAGGTSVFARGELVVRRPRHVLGIRRDALLDETGLQKVFHGTSLLRPGRAPRSASITVSRGRSAAWSNR